MSRRFLVLFAGLLAVALIGIGCGSSDESNLSKAEFLKQGNAICKAGNEDVNTGFEEFAEEKNLNKNEEPPKPVLEEAAETVLIPSISKQVEELRDLGTPEGDEGELDQLLTGAEEALEKGEEDPSSLTSNGPGPFAKVNQEARAYGLTACGEEG